MAANSSTSQDLRKEKKVERFLYKKITFVEQNNKIYKFVETLEEVIEEQVNINGTSETSTSETSTSNEVIDLTKEDNKSEIIDLTMDDEQMNITPNQSPQYNTPVYSPLWTPEPPLSPYWSDYHSSPEQNRDP